MIIILPSYKVDGALSCHGSKMELWKTRDVVYGLIFLYVVVALQAFYSDVFERLSTRLK